MERLLEETWGTGLFQYRTLFLNVFELVGMQVTIQSIFGHRLEMFVIFIH